MRHPLRLRHGVEGVGSTVGLAKAREVVEVEHLDRVFSVKPQHLLLWRDLLAAAANAPEHLVLPPCKRFQRRRLVHWPGGTILEDVVCPPRVAGEHVAEGAVVDDGGPGAMLLDDLSRAVEIGTLALDLLEASGLPSNHRLGPGLARLGLRAVGDAVAQLARPLAYVGGWLPEHASYLAGGLHSVEARDSLPMLPARCWADLQVGGEVVAALVLRKVGLARGVPACEARVADALACQNLPAVIVLRLWHEDCLLYTSPSPRDAHES
eukprot:4523299-Prymnesium_polylepis.1